MSTGPSLPRRRRSPPGPPGPSRNGRPLSPVRLTGPVRTCLIAPPCSCGKTARRLRKRGGNGLVPGVTVGPLHTRAGLERGLGLVAAARQAGATVIELGRVEDETAFADGYFMRPMIVTDVPDDARLVAEEQFCPAIPVLRYHDLDDAVARANSSIFGLGGSVWGDDVARAAAVAARLDGGTVFVNTHGTNAVNRKAPYGGVKQSGKGRRAGLEGMMEYLQLQTLTTYEHD